MAHDQSILTIPLSEKLKSIPGIFGIRLVEEPLYEVLQTSGEKEIRRYHPFITASITVNGSFKEASKEAFFCLANYIFGKNKDKKLLKMTAPVLQEETNDYIPMTSPVFQGPAHNGWTMSFVLPMEYSLATAPTPKDKRIHLSKTHERLVATLQYSGINDQNKIRKYSAELIQWLSRNYTYTPLGEIQSAQYDGPTTIPFFRKNEIHLEVTKAR
ncbi:MAG: heme-binding protein [Bacteriovorax sp.]|nr:heme-binding protein [Bacteriovorax sp.]